MKNKFKKGLILGGLLAVGSVVGFAMTRGGKKVTQELGEDVQTLTKNLKKNLGDLEDVTKKGFNAVVSSVVDEYAEKKGLAIKAKNSLLALLQGQWDELEKEYKAAQGKTASKPKSKK